MQYYWKRNGKTWRHGCIAESVQLGSAIARIYVVVSGRWGHLRRWVMSPTHTSLYIPSNIDKNSHFRMIKSGKN